MMIPVIPVAPVALVSVFSLHIAMMPDGHLAIFDEGHLSVCECNGGVVEALPDGSLLVAGLVAQGRIVSVFEYYPGGFDEVEYYTVDQETRRVVKLAQSRDCAPFHTDWPDMPTA